MTAPDRESARSPKSLGPHGPSGCEVADLGAVAATMSRAVGDGREERSAQSLFQTAEIGSIVTALRAGASVQNEHPDEATTIQGLTGECLISLDGNDASIGEGTLVGIPAGVPWHLVARTDAVILLTVSRPD